MGFFLARFRSIAETVSISAYYQLLCLAIFGSVLMSRAAQAQQITPVGGFHSTSETDAFAKKGLLEITSVPAPISGVSGARATVSVSCSRQSYNGLENLVGIEVIPDLVFNIAVTGASLDVGPSSGGTFSIDAKVRFDENDPYPFVAPASDIHHLEFRKEPDEDFKARILLIGFPVSGKTAALRLNLREPKVADLIDQCGTVRDRILKARAAEQEKYEQKKKEEAAQFAEQQRQHDEQQKRQQEYYAAEAARKKKQEFDRYGTELTPSERGALDQITPCLTNAGLGPIPPQALIRQSYDNFMASPNVMPIWKQWMHRSESSPDRNIGRLNIIMKTTRPVTAWAKGQIGDNNRRNRELPAGTFITVEPDYLSCQSIKVFSRTDRNPQPKTYIHTYGHSTDGEFSIQIDALTYATDGQAWCKENCIW